MGGSGILMSVCLRSGSDEVLLEPTYVSIWFSISNSCGVPEKCPSGIAFGISLLESCLQWFVVVGSYRVLIFR